MLPARRLRPYRGRQRYPRPIRRAVVDNVERRRGLRGHRPRPHPKAGPHPRSRRRNSPALSSTDSSAGVSNGITRTNATHCWSRNVTVYKREGIMETERLADGSTHIGLLDIWGEIGEWDLM